MPSLSPSPEKRSRAALLNRSSLNVRGSFENKGDISLPNIRGASEDRYATGSKSFLEKS